MQISCVLSGCTHEQSKWFVLSDSNSIVHLLLNHFSFCLPDCFRGESACVIPVAYGRRPAVYRRKWTVWSSAGSTIDAVTTSALFQKRHDTTLTKLGNGLSKHNHVTGRLDSLVCLRVCCLSRPVSWAVRSLRPFPLPPADNLSLLVAVFRPIRRHD